MDTFKEILDYIVNNESKKTVGIIMKRFELAIENKQELSIKEINELKSQVKESIYEAYRNIRDFLKTGKFILNFKNKT